jgi:hypothetical protein
MFYYTEKNVYLGEQKILLITTQILVCYDKAANALPQQRFLTGFAGYEVCSAIWP